VSEEIMQKALENVPALAATWIIGRPLLDKLLGPTADYLGGVNAQLAKRAVDNLDKVFKKALDKTGERINVPGQVPPKVLKSIVDNAAYCEDEIATSYYGGVLASSRTGISRDDRGASFSSIVSNLSTYQLRSHYIFYALFFKEFGDKCMNPALSTEREKMRIFIPYSSFLHSMDFIEGEDINAILPHIFGGLTSRSLIDQQYAFGDSNIIRSIFPTAPDGFSGLIFQPSTLGIELFLWAHGQGNVPISMSLMNVVEKERDESVILPNDSIALIK
jgi:hypothetical protein